MRAQGPVVVLSLKDAMEWTTVHLCGLEQMSLSPLSLRRFPITERNTHVTWKLPIRRTMVLNSSLCFHTTSSAFAYIAWSRATTVSSRPSWVSISRDFFLCRWSTYELAIANRILSGIFWLLATALNPLQPGTVCRESIITADRLGSRDKNQPKSLVIALQRWSAVLLRVGSIADSPGPRRFPALH